MANITVLAPVFSLVNSVVPVYEQNMSAKMTISKESVLDPLEISRLVLVLTVTGNLMLITANGIVIQYLEVL